jgi:hypothetical protein
MNHFLCNTRQHSRNFLIDYKVSQSTHYSWFWQLSSSVPLWQGPLLAGGGAVALAALVLEYLANSALRPIPVSKS